MIAVTFNADEVTDALDRIAAGLTDMTDLMEELGELLVASTKDRFTEGKAPDGTPWAPKSQATIAAYLARGDRVAFRPLFGPSGRLSSEIAHRAGPQSVEVGSSLIYAAVQQFGAAKGAFGTNAIGRPIPWGNIPARPFLGLSEEDETNILATIDEWLARSAGE
ncbi:phage virion morphogenesis protein [Maritimibacter sp. 55A14]|uniref:phage virion morphogenesis protein n=1 Tax=Maritimibacter sp. 55A14 TaxID=2174844 RepID=UPI000D613FCA|nr:phage virion morphogenesis protein [Maritimibacter sp. 55A14]PWE29972.1 phage virion morphogenesis protein [Maritimibacter sp. 55A14]